MDCPELNTLAAYVESGVAAGPLLKHVAACDACQEAMETLRDEVLSLQIPLSEIWFREHISCPGIDLLRDYRRGRAGSQEARYLQFHVEELGCAYCQARLEEEDLLESREGAASLRDSRLRTGKAASDLLRGIGD